MAPKNTKYYEVLGVQSTATEDEINKGYKRAALRCHPDKNIGNPEATAQFTEVGLAYSVLSDPKKRKTYDRYGPEAVALLESGVPANFAMAMDRGELLQSMCSGCILLMLMLLFAILIVLHTEAVITTSWSVVFVPIWVIDLVVFFPSVLSKCCSRQSILELAYDFSRWALLCALQVLVVLTLDSQLPPGARWPLVAEPFWLQAAIPLAIFELLGLARSLLLCRYSVYVERLSAGAPQCYCGIGYVGYVLRALYWWALRVATWVLGVLLLSGIARYSWWVVLAPVLAGLLLQWLVQLLDLTVILMLRPAGHDDNYCVVFACAMFCWCVPLALLVAFLGMTAQTLDFGAVAEGAAGIGGTSGGIDYASPIIFVPLWLLLGPLMCCFCMCVPVVCLCGSAPGDMDDSDSSDSSDNDDVERQPLNPASQSKLPV